MTEPTGGGSVFCPACGEEKPPHARCVVQFELEPPRFRGPYGRRMVVLRQRGERRRTAKFMMPPVDDGDWCVDTTRRNAFGFRNLV